VLTSSSRDAGWSEVLEGLTASAQYASQALVEVLLSWRKAGLAQAQQLASDFGPPSLMVLRKRVGASVLCRRLGGCDAACLRPCPAPLHCNVGSMLFFTADAIRAAHL